MKRLALLLVAVLALAGAALYLLAPAVLLDAEFARQAALAGLHKRALVAAGHRWSYYEGGAGDAVVLVHGFTGSKENWLPFARRLGTGHRVIVPDLPGWGESQRRAQEDYRVPAQVRRLAAFIDALGVERVHLAGHSMGGHIAGVFAAEYPGRIASLALIDSAGVPYEENAFARRTLAGEMPFNFGNRAEFDRFAALMFARPPWLPGRLKDVLVERNRAGHAFHVALLAKLTEVSELFRLKDALPRITAPTLVLWCRQDQVLDVSSVAVLEAGMPQAEVALFDDCGHMAMMEKPRYLAARYLAFLAATASR